MVKGVLKKTQVSENAIFSGVAKSRGKRKLGQIAIKVANSVREALIKTKKGKQVARVAMKDTFKIKQGKTLAINALRVSMRKIQVLSNVCNAPIP